MQKNHLKEFSELIAMLSEVYAKDVSPKLVEFYFEALRDLDYNEIHQNAIQYINIPNKNKFPSPGDLRGIDTRADKALTIITEYMDKFYSPDFHGVTMHVIRNKMRIAGHEYLFPILQKWGYEITCGNNPTATRAQFLKSYQSEKEFSAKQLMSIKKKGEPKQLKAILKQIEIKKENV